MSSGSPGRLAGAAAWACTGSLVAFVAAGCMDGKGSSATADAAARGGARPAYALTEGPLDPLTQKLCDALHTLPALRRATCCNAASSASVTVADCNRTLGAAVRGGAVTLVASEVDACVAAMQAAFDGCDWVGPRSPSVPPNCGGLIHGNLEQGSGCRSSLECKPSLNCRGATALVPGTCAQPQDNGGACETFIDPLVAAGREEDVATLHPECLGHCERGRCTSPISPGGPCASSVQCDALHHCAKTRCLKGPYARSDEDCTKAPCAPGTRCINGRCAVPAGPGKPCDSDVQCRGACIRSVSVAGPGGTSAAPGGKPPAAGVPSRGVCGMDCARQ